MSSIEQVDHVVVGGGVMGLATASALARRGERVTVVERFARGHTHGASHGATRNFNNAYAEDHYLDLLARSREGWDRLSRDTDEPLLRLHGLVTHGSDQAELEDVHRALERRGIPASLLDRAEASRQWSGMRFEQTVLHSPDAGVIHAEAALARLEHDIRRAGGHVLFGARVLGIDADTATHDGMDEGADGATVTLTHDGQQRHLRARRVIVTAGAWTRPLLSHLVTLPDLRVTEEHPAHFQEVAAASNLAVWPSFNHLVAPGTHPADVYGMPTPGEGIKVGFHRVGEAADPDRRVHAPTAEHAHRLREYVREWMPGLDPASAVSISCTYTSTPDGAFVLDRRGALVIGAGFSGHGFKFAPGVGEQLADLALDPRIRAAAPFRLPA